MPGWTVRRGAPADAADVAAVRVRSWRHAYAGIVPAAVLAGMRPENGVTRWAEIMVEPPPRATFVAVDAADANGGAGRPVAFCSVGGARQDRDRHPELPTGELYAIYADPAVQGTGAGGLLHDAGLDHLARQGFRHVVLWVLEDNEQGRRFYAARGWRPDDAAADLDFAGRMVREIRLSRPLPAVGAGQPSSV